MRGRRTDVVARGVQVEAVGDDWSRFEDLLIGLMFELLLLRMNCGGKSVCLTVDCIVLCVRVDVE